jgi:hypothetical protein
MDDHHDPHTLLNRILAWFGKTLGFIAILSTIVSLAQGDFHAGILIVGASLLITFSAACLHIADAKKRERSFVNSREVYAYRFPRFRRPLIAMSLIPLVIVGVLLVVPVSRAFVLEPFPTRRDANGAVSTSTVISGSAEQTATPTQSVVPSSPTEAPAKSLFEQIRAGVSLSYAEAILGPPLVVGDNEFSSEQIYLYSGNWVQLVHDDKGKVLLLAVTDCSSDSKQTIETPVYGNQSADAAGTVTLNETTLAEAGMGSPDYFIGAHDVYFFEEYFRGNPGQYKEWAVGFSDACPLQAFSPDFATLEQAISRESVLGQDKRTWAVDWKEDADIAEFRSTARITTYAETAPGVTLDSVDAADLLGTLVYQIRGLPQYSTTP